MWCNPLTYCVEAVRAMFYTDVSKVTGGWHPSLWLSTGVVVAFAVVMFAASVALANRRREP